MFHNPAAMNQMAVLTAQNDALLAHGRARQQAIRNGTYNPADFGDDRPAQNASSTSCCSKDLALGLIGGLGLVGGVVTLGMKNGRAASHNSEDVSAMLLSVSLVCFATTALSYAVYCCRYYSQKNNDAAAQNNNVAAVQTPVQNGAPSADARFVRLEEGAA